VDWCEFPASGATGSPVASCVGVLFYRRCGALRLARERRVKVEDSAKLFDLFSRVVFAVAALLLMMLALVIIGNVFIDLVSSLLTGQAAGIAALSSIGFVVVSIAVFDVAKYLIDEEVVRAREMRAAGETRRSLTRFISTISIAIFLESLVTIFRVGKEDVTNLGYPTMLLISAILLVVGLGVYQRLSAEVERQVEHKDRAAAAEEAK
jgi:hypothetical protein